MAWALDWDYRFDPQWTPPGSPVRPWFLVGDLPAWKPEDYWKIALHYRAEKIAFVRNQLAGIDRAAALKSIMTRLWDGAHDDRERFERLIHFIQQMMSYPNIEQPLEADALQTFRRECTAPTDQAEPYLEDLETPWARQAFAEAKLYGKYLGVWCNPFAQKFTGDWGLRGCVTDALELLLLHEGRCGHQAVVLVQLAQAGGWRARLVQGVSHRYSEVLLDGRWVLADSDGFANGFIPTTPQGDLPTLDWMRHHPEIVNTWPALHHNPAGTAAYYGATPRS